jgi:4-hydroxybenzoate polyprenyltransferase
VSAFASEASAPLARRLWIYQSERFPVFKTALLLTAFASASVNVSAFLAGRSLPGIGTYAAAFVVLFILFFQLRACDELKDRDDDQRYRPERPIPRGLVNLSLILGIGIGLIPVAAAAAAALGFVLLLPLLAVWFWLALMTAEFGVPEWLKARPALYVVSHMLIMPLMDLFVTGAEWLVRAGIPPKGLWLFLALSFLNGCVLEIGRKLYAPENERPGVETYTALYGIHRATWTWIACLSASFALLCGVGFAVGAPGKISVVGAVAFLAAAGIGIRFAGSPTPSRQKTVDAAAGLWVFVCYTAAGFLPLARW